MSDQALCIKCQEEFPFKRKRLGYDTCLKCGDVAAKKIMKHRSRCTAPAFNKGAYMYVSSRSMAKDLGRQNNEKMLVVMSKTAREDPFWAEKLKPEVHRLAEELLRNLESYDKVTCKENAPQLKAQLLRFIKKMRRQHVLLRQSDYILS